MPFSLKNASQTCQTFIHDVTRDMEICFPYIDDFLASDTEEEHKTYFETLFQRLEQYGIIINPEKSIFGISNITFLGYFVSADGITPTKEKVDAIFNFNQPEDLNSLRRFLDMVNFYRSSIPKAADLQSPPQRFLER